MTDDYKSLLRERIFDDDTFVDLTMKGPVRGQQVPWRKIVVRPVQVKQRRHLQVSCFDAKQDITKNYRDGSAAEKIDEILAIPFSAIHLRSTNEDLVVQLTKKGKALVQRTKRAEARPEPTLAHNRAKALPLPPEEAGTLLEALGIANAQGQIRPHMQDKFAQINEFLKLLEGTGELEKFARASSINSKPLTIVDCGCGSSYLTFATYHYLNKVRGIPATLVGVDVNEELMRKSTAHSAQLGYDDLCFRASPIIDFTPEVAPDIVLALHACDTATDEALARAVAWDAHMILAVPCCHHDLNAQIASELFRPVLRHGILKQRMADILTDSFRALALRIVGYRTEVIEFISSEHTARNLMIRAVKATAPGAREFVQEYNDLKRFWNVTPAIERLLGEPFMRLLEAV